MPAFTALRHTQARQWHRLNTTASSRTPKIWHPWLSHPGSLTKVLRQASHGQFRVRLITQKTGLPNAAERQALGLKPRQYALIREVELLGYGQIWVCARTVIPLHALQGRCRMLRLLGERSLGSWLFQDPALTRKPFEVAQLSNGDWARRSVFICRGEPLLVSEAFMPALKQVEWPLQVSE